MQLSEKEHTAIMHRVRDGVNALLKEHDIKQRTCWYAALLKRQSSLLQFAWLIGKKKQIGFPNWDTGFRLIHSDMAYQLHDDKKNFCFIFAYARQTPGLIMGMIYELNEVDLATRQVFNWLQNGMWPTADGCHEEQSPGSDETETQPEGNK
jgi:hypothetical protein